MVRRHLRLLVLLLLAVALAVVLVPAAPAGAAWRAPVDGPVVGRFELGPDRFAGGQRRGVDLAAPPGTAVVAPCSGSVAFAGALPRRGAGVSIHCGSLTATVLGLTVPVVRRGARVRAGERLGLVGPAGRVRLGARRSADRFGYRDPLALLGGARRTAPRIAPGPLRGPRRGPAGSADPPVVRHAAAATAAPLPVPAPVPARAGAPAPAPPPVPLVAWLGLALVAVALPAGAVLRGGRHGRHRQRAALGAK